MVCILLDWVPSNILADEFPPKYKHRSWHKMWFILLRFLLNIQHRCNQLNGTVLTQHKLGANFLK